jgi:hypothetical protein
VGHKLANHILDACKTTKTPCLQLIFDLTNAPIIISALKPYIGQSGWMQVSHLEINSFEYEDYLIAACFTEDGTVIENELAHRMFSLNATENDSCIASAEISKKLAEILYAEKQAVVDNNANRNKDFFDTEMDKLDQWADDMKISLDKEIKDLDAEIKLRKSEAKKMLNLEAKVKAQRAIKELEKKRSEKRQNLYEAQDTIDERKDDLLNEIERRLHQEIKATELFVIKWKIT